MSASGYCHQMMQLNVEQARGHVAVPRTLRRVNLRRVIGMLSAMLHLLGGESCDNHEADDHSQILAA